MKRWISVTLQIVGSAGQIVNLLEPVLKPEQKLLVAAGIGIVQIVVNAIAHGSNPDGTPAEVAWTPAKPPAAPNNGA